MTQIEPWRIAHEARHHFEHAAFIWNLYRKGKISATERDSALRPGRKAIALKRLAMEQAQ